MNPRNDDEASGRMQFKMNISFQLRTLALLFFSGLCFRFGNAQQVPDFYANPSAWVLDRHNEFATEKLVFNSTLTVWDTYSETNGFTWAARSGVGRFDEWFDPTNVKVENGYLKLWTEAENCPYANCLARDGNQKQYSGAELICGSSFSDLAGNTKYGFYEMECKIPLGGGFTAWWLSVKNGNQNYKTHPPELDMFEAITPCCTCSTALTNLHGQLFAMNEIDNYSNTYYLHKQDKPSSFFAASHKFGLYWGPEVIKMYLDGNYTGEIRLAVHDVNVLTSLRMAFSFQLFNEQLHPCGLNQPLEIDYIRYYIPAAPFHFVDPDRWGIAWQDFKKDRNFDDLRVTNEADRFFVGDFYGTGSDDLMVTRADHKGISNQIEILRLEAQGGNQRNKWAAMQSQVSLISPSWNIDVDDQYIIGDFSANHSGTEILAISGHHNAELIGLSATGFSTLFASQNWISNWRIGEGDQFFAGNFDADSNDELLCVSLAGYVTLFDFVNGNWVQICSNYPNLGTISTWNLSPGDRFVIGNFANDGHDELLIFSRSKYAKMFSFNGSNWTQIWGAGTPVFATNFIGGWRIDPDDKYIVGDWDDDNYDEFVAFSPNGKYAKIQKYSSQTWLSVWGNNGSGKLYNWWNKHSDKIVSGDFVRDNNCNALSQLLMIRGTNSFIPKKLRDNPYYKNYRAGIFFSPLSQFWSNPIMGKTQQRGTAELEVDSQEAAQVYVYPNPSRDGRFTISGNVENAYEIYSISGRLIQQGSGTTLDLSTQESGVYLLNIIFEDGKRACHKIVKL